MFSEEAVIRKCALRNLAIITLVDFIVSGLILAFDTVNFETAIFIFVILFINSSILVGLQFKDDLTLYLKQRQELADEIAKALRDKSKGV